MNHRLYSYMHDIFGADVIEIFDMQYNPEDKYGNKKESDEKRDDSGAGNKGGGEDALKS